MTSAKRKVVSIVLFTTQNVYNISITHFIVALIRLELGDDIVTVCNKINKFKQLRFPEVVLMKDNEDKHVFLI